MNQAAESDVQKIKLATPNSHGVISDVHAATNRAPVAQLLNLADLGSAEDSHANRDNRQNPVSAANMAKAVIDGKNPLHNIKTRLTICVGAAEVTVGELLGAREQQVLLLDRTIEQPVDIMLEGQVVARGILIAVDDHFGVRITELPVPLTA